jgi:hypothetical protein
VLVGVALVPTAVLVAALLRDGPPARLLIGGQHGADVSDGIVLNTRHPVRLAVQVLDAKGHALSSTDVRYRWTSGIPISVAPSGVVTCKREGDATVRASVGTLATSVLLRCRPVRTVLTERGLNFVTGGAGRDLHIAAFGPDGRPVSLLAGEVRVEDSTIATLKGTHIRPLAPGQTMVKVRIGDAQSWTGVTVYEPVRSLVGLRPGQNLVVAPVRLAPGDTIRWPLPVGLLSVQYTPASRGQPAPSITVAGPIMCMPAFGPRVDDSFCLARGPGASISIAHPGTSTRPIVGTLALDRRSNDESARPSLTPVVPKS